MKLFDFLFLRKFKAREYFDKGYYKAKLCFEKITDQRKFAKIAEYKNASDYFRKMAIEKLDKHIYQDLLVNIAKNDRNWFVRHKAVEYLTNEEIRQSVYADLAKNGDYYGWRIGVIDLLTNKEIRQSICATIVKNVAEKSEIRRDAIERLDTDTNQPLFAEIFKNDNDDLVRLCAIGKLKPADNQQLFAEIVKDRTRYKEAEKIEAVQKLTDQKLIFDFALVALQSKRNYTVQYALRSLTNQEYLVCVANSLTRHNESDYDAFIACYDILIEKLGKEKMPKSLEAEYGKARKDAMDEESDRLWNLYVKGQNCG